MASLKTLLNNHNCDLLIDLGSSRLEESKDVKFVKTYFDELSKSINVPYFLHSNKVDFTDDILGKNLIADNNKNLIVTKFAQLKMLDDQSFTFMRQTSET